MNRYFVRVIVGLALACPALPPTAESASGTRRGRRLRVVAEAPGYDSAVFNMRVLYRPSVLTVSGRVTDIDNNPVTNATVKLLELEAASGVDTNGTYRLEARPGGKRPFIMTASFGLDKTVTSAHVRTKHAAAVPMPGECPLAITVHDQDDDPVRGRDVTFALENADALPFLSLKPEREIIDARGQCSVKLIARPLATDTDYSSLWDLPLKASVLVTVMNPLAAGVLTEKRLDIPLNLSRVVGELADSNVAVSPLPGNPLLKRFWYDSDRRGNRFCALVRPVDNDLFRPLGLDWVLAWPGTTGPPLTHGLGHPPEAGAILDCGTIRLNPDTNDYDNDGVFDREDPKPELPGTPGELLQLSEGSPGLVFYDDFSNGLGAWKTNDVDPVIEEGRALFVASAYRKKMLVLKHKVPREDVDIQFMGYVENDGIQLFLVDHLDMGYRYHFGSGNNNCSGLTVVRGRHPFFFREGKVYQPKTWHHYRLIRHGSDFMLYRDGQRVGGGCIPPVFRCGARLAFAARDGRVGVDSVSVRRLAPLDSPRYAETVVLEDSMAKADMSHWSTNAIVPKPQDKDPRFHFFCPQHKSLVLKRPAAMRDVAVELKCLAREDGFALKWEQPAVGEFAVSFGGWRNARSALGFGEGMPLYLNNGPTFHLRRWQHYRVQQAGGRITASVDGRFLLGGHPLVSCDGDADLSISAWNAHLGFCDFRVLALTPDVDETQRMARAQFSYQDAMSEPLANWHFAGIEPEWIDGKLHCLCHFADGRVLALKTPIPMENIKIAFDGYIESDGIAVTLETASGLHYHISPGAWHNTCSAIDVGGSRHMDRALQKGKVCDLKTWQRYEITRQGDLLLAHIGGELAISRIVPQQFVGNGTLMLSSGNSRIGIHDLTITQLESPPVPDEWTIVFSNDFDQGVDNWNADTIDEELEDGQVFFTAQKGKALLSEGVDLPMENVRVEFDGYTEKDGILLHLVNDQGEGYQTLLGVYGNVRSVVSKVDAREPGWVYRDGPVFKPKQWHRYGLVRQNDRLIATCDGEILVSRLLDSDIKGPARLKFLAVWPSRIGIDNVRVYAMEAPSGGTHATVVQATTTEKPESEAVEVESAVSQVPGASILLPETKPPPSETGPPLPETKPSLPETGPLLPETKPPRPETRPLSKSPEPKAVDGPVSITEVSRDGESIIVSLKCPGIDPGTILYVDLSLQQNASQARRIPSIAPKSGALTIRFTAPLLGWPPGTYDIAVHKDESVLVRTTARIGAK
jgi:hypothetical protein